MINDFSSQDAKEILDLMRDDKEFYWWKIGTNISNILKFFFTWNKIINENEILESDVITVENNLDYYSIVFNKTDIRINPNTDNKSVDSNTMYQYLRVLVAFNFISPLGIEPKNMSEYLNNSLYMINPKLKKYSNFEEVNDIKFKWLVINAKKNSIKEARTLVYSIIVFYIANKLKDDSDVIYGIKTAKSGIQNMHISEILFDSKKSGYDLFEEDLLKEDFWDEKKSIEKIVKSIIE